MRKITRRQLFERLGQVTTTVGFSALSLDSTLGERQRQAAQLDSPPPPSVLPGTEPLTTEGDLAAQMVEGIRSYLLRRIASSVDDRRVFWNRDFSSPQAYEASVEPNRRRFREVIGLRDERVAVEGPSLTVAVGGESPVATGGGYDVYAARWPALPKVDAEGLLLAPKSTPVARIVALPDADWSPEALVGLAEGISQEAQFARRLAENGCLVLVPVLIDRKNTWSSNSELSLYTNLTHREFIYRMAYEVGRHVIGYEVQKVLAAVDWFQRCAPTRPIGVMGHGEGGLLALYSAAADARIDAAVVSGYFQSRQELWQEPLYRNVWTLLREFGDAELAGLIAPRALVVEASRGPEIPGPPLPTEQQSDAAASGRLVSPPLDDVRAEIERTKPVFQKLGAEKRLSVVVSDNGQGNPGSEPALRAFLAALGAPSGLKPSATAPRDGRKKFNPSDRLYRQFEQLVSFTQEAVLRSEAVRAKFWAKADDSSVEQWQQSTESYRRYLWEEVLGKLPEPSEPLAAQTRRIYEEVDWTGYEVMLPLWPEVYAYGILLLPKALVPGDRRPVVVCQHGLEGRPQDLIKPDRVAEHFYHRFAANLADHGFIIYCPQNPYIGGDKFRKIQRLANPLKCSLFSFILSQHKRTLDWLSQQPFVDPSRIGFYGLSYGGKTAVRVPPLLDKYCLSICSGDFNEWIWKVSRNDASFTYVFTPEYEVPEFNLGNTFNHSDMAKLMTPRPFMVERGHDDGVSIDPWVAYEYSKVRRHYDLMGLSDRTRIEFFNGPHTIHSAGTFQFLHHFLDWGEPFGW